MVWSEVDDTLAWRQYRIRNVAADTEFPWRLEWHVSSAVSGASTIETIRCGTQAAAQRAAVEKELERARNLRAAIHTAIAVAALYLFLWLTVSSWSSLAGFAVALLALASAVRSIGNAIAAKRRDLWGWQPDGGYQDHPSLLDRLCRRAVARFGVASIDPRSDGPLAVRVLPPLA